MSNQTYRPSVEQAIDVGRAVSALGLAICLGILILEVFGFIEAKREHSFTSAKKRAPIWLLAISIWGLWVLLNCFTMWWIDWRGNEAGCNTVTVPMSPIVYITMKQCLYLFLYDRAKIVHEALNLNGKWMKRWRWIVWLSCAVGVPILTWWLFFIFWRSKVLPEGICVQYFLSTAGVAAVAAADFILSLSLLILFIVPLMKHVQHQHVNSGVSTHVFRRLMCRNLAVSLIMMSSTLAALLAMCIELSTAFGEHPDPSVEYIQIWSTFFPLLDTIVTITMPHFLSNAWLPRKIRHFLVHRSSHGSSKLESKNGLGNKDYNLSAAYRTTATSPELSPGSHQSKHLSINKLAVSPVGEQQGYA
jgi:hypothetical protein